MITTNSGYCFVDTETKAVSEFVTPDIGDLSVTRFNDGKTDPAGRFWAGTMDKRVSNPTGKLLCCEPDGTCTIKDTDLVISNGMCWTQDNKTMYFIDSIPNVCYGYDYNMETGNISNRREAIKGESGCILDGMTIDANDNVWIALFHGWSINHYNPQTGELLRKVRMPVARVTSCCFGGDDLLDLYITTARAGEDETEGDPDPLAGSLFVMRAEVPGFVVPKFNK